MKNFPGTYTGWIPGYNPKRLKADVIAGLTVALVLIPQSMAYAELAGLPPYFGLYAAFLPPMIAAFPPASRTASAVASAVSRFCA